VFEIQLGAKLYYKIIEKIFIHSLMK